MTSIMLLPLNFVLPFLIVTNDVVVLKVTGPQTINTANDYFQKLLLLTISSITQIKF